MADGYARNFLLPKRLAVAATAANRKIIEQERQAHLRREAKLQAEAEDLAKLMTGVTVTIAQKAGENDQLFGSVTAKDIAEALEKQDFTIDRRKIHVEEPIKQLGEYKIPAASAPGRDHRYRGRRLREEKGSVPLPGVSGEPADGAEPHLLVERHRVAVGGRHGQAGRRACVIGQGFRECRSNSDLAPLAHGLTHTCVMWPHRGATILARHTPHMRPVAASKAAKEAGL